MKFYAYRLTDGGGEPTGSANRLLFELKTVKGGIRRAVKQLGKYGRNIRLFSYTNFYDIKTFTEHFRN